MTSEEKHEPYYRQKVSIYKSNEATPEILFVGDSTTDHGEWNELFPDKAVGNRGISNDNTIGVLDRLDEIVSNKSEKIFIMIGINDILYGHDEKDIIKNYKEIITKLKQQLPATEIYIQSILPVNNDLYGSAINNKDVKTINKKLEKLDDNKQVIYLDIYDSLSKNDQLDKKYTIDGIHLTGEGYTVWKNEITSFIN